MLYNWPKKLQVKFAVRKTTTTTPNEKRQQDGCPHPQANPAPQTAKQTKRQQHFTKRNLKIGADAAAFESLPKPGSMAFVANDATHLLISIETHLPTGAEMCICVGKGAAVNDARSMSAETAKQVSISSVES